MGCGSSPGRGLAPWPLLPSSALSSSRRFVVASSGQGKTGRSPAVHSVNVFAAHAGSALPSDMLLFGYGSGSAATLLYAKVHRLPANFRPLAPVLGARRQLSYKEATAVLQRHLF